MTPSIFPSRVDVTGLKQEADRVGWITAIRLSVDHAPPSLCALYEYRQSGGNDDLGR